MGVARQNNVSGEGQSATKMNNYREWKAGSRRRKFKAPKAKKSSKARASPISKFMVHNSNRKMRSHSPKPKWTLNFAGTHSRGYTQSSKHLIHHHKESNTITVLERTGIKISAETLRQAGLNFDDIPILDTLPLPPTWFPKHITDIITSDRCPENVSFTSLLQLTKFRTLLSKSERKCWKSYVRCGRWRLSYELRLEQYLGCSTPPPPPLVADCKRRVGRYTREAKDAMAKLDMVVGGARCLDEIMKVVFENERRIYEDCLPNF